jgi:hypothetical protein
MFGNRVERILCAYESEKLATGKEKCERRRVGI